jgi:hypothetical protein
MQEHSTSSARDAALTISDIARQEIDAGLVSARLKEVYAQEHPIVMGGRAGACLFSSFVFPAGLWAVGGVSATVAALIAAVMTLLASRTILFLGGMRIARVLALEVAVAAAVLIPDFSPVPAILFAVFFPLLGMLSCVSAGAQAAVTWFAGEDRPHEVDVVIARATQSNVVDIRSRRVPAKSQGESGVGDVGEPPLPQEHTN